MEQKKEEDLKEKLEKCEKQKADYLAGWQRARADFLNYKKEEMERISSLIFYAHEEMLLKFLPVLDNFNRAEKEIKDETSLKGFQQIKEQFQSLLKDYGIEEMKTIDQKFDPNFHEAVEQVEVKDNGSAGSPQEKSGMIIEEIEKGYLIQGRVLRAAKVKVAK